MTNRRSFFKQLSMGLVALSAPSLFIPKLIEPVKWKVNPAFDIAEYDIELIRNYESYIFTFVPSFSDFWIDYLKGNLA